ncbi:MAG: hypothetical protein WCH99_00015 [Verrucomicrobiota bacterium]
MKPFSLFFGSALPTLRSQLEKEASELMAVFTTMINKTKNKSRD